MRERPIIFTPENAQKVFNDKKTQTRRVIEPPPERWHTVKRKPFTRDDQPGIWSPLSDNSDNHKCPFGLPGDRLWVRETWKAHERPSDCTDGVLYKGDGSFKAIEPTPNAANNWIIAHDNGRFGDKWRNAMFMPRWASRTLLEIVEIRVQRVQEINDEDARAEGEYVFDGERLIYAETQQQKDAIYRSEFPVLWESINAKRGFGWHTNPWVWCLSFKRLIDV